MLEAIDGRRDPRRRTAIDALTDPFALRVPGRQHNMRTAGEWVGYVAGKSAAWVERGRASVRRHGWVGFGKLVARRLLTPRRP